ncbi:hypothetical protein [Nonomuraea rubra]|uniref:hypothetical protein n=1 Tax=Nonomuraea rubra TaxID=46180 RepID=UPI0031E6A835
MTSVGSALSVSEGTAGLMVTTGPAWSRRSRRGGARAGRAAGPAGAADRDWSR